ncbi:hypothetical protein [Halonatronum saccharophilum]|uniref:hypothetical protein n=1 Tax=Halonatronum saccharophilum TaxID=150060 RepID=UPI000481B245|nr:hypothetical protein [Halonatronum saccharophilum]
MKRIIFTILISFTLIFSSTLAFAEEIDEAEEIKEKEELREESSRLRDFEEEVKRGESGEDMQYLRKFLRELFINTFFSSDRWLLEMVYKTTSFPYRAPYSRIERRYRYNPNYNRLDNEGFNIDMGVARAYIDNNLKSNRLELNINLDRFAFELSYVEYKEELYSRNEYISFTDGIITYSFAKDRRWDFRSGIGLQRVSGIDSETRLKYLYGVEFFDKPLKLNLDLGFALSEKNFIGEFFPAISYDNDYFELRAGYRRYKVINQSLSGPELALKFNF